MGFRENLKEELKYQGMLVKELASKSGVPKGTIDHYLAEKCTEPIAESAVKNCECFECICRIFGHRKK